MNLNNLQGKTILIVGGGTSTLDRRWEHTPYDVLWTCNDFYKEERLLNVKVDTYMFGNTTDLKSNQLIDKLNKDKPTVFYEPHHYRGKHLTEEFKIFALRLDVPVFETNINPGKAQGRECQKAGATFRLIQLALESNASYINYVGFDGFDKEFSNKHAFTKHVGLKDTDTRRDWFSHYYTPFVDAHNFFVETNAHQRLQNLGEGLPYNIGTEVSKVHYPLKKELYEKCK